MDVLSETPCVSTLSAGKYNLGGTNAAWQGTLDEFQQLLGLLLTSEVVVDAGGDALHVGGLGVRLLVDYHLAEMSESPLVLAFLPDLKREKEEWATITVGCVVTSLHAPAHTPSSSPWPRFGGIPRTSKQGR